MSTPKLPSKLAKEPLIDVVFEMRFSSHVAVSTVLPGLLFSKLSGVGNIESLPISHLPQQIREMDPTLHFSPLNRIAWGKFAILVGDRSVGVGCSIPYPGWSDFKDAIERVFHVVNEAGLIKTIDRYSVKYVDFFETGDDCALALSQFNIGLRIGTHDLRAENTVLRVEIPRSNFLHAVQVMTSATVQLPAIGARSGAILDVDTLSVAPVKDISIFAIELSTLLDEIHLANKQMFFECLSENGLRNLEPQYE